VVVNKVKVNKKQENERWNPTLTIVQNLAPTRINDKNTIAKPVSTDFA
jgi:hypothetical protein